MPTETSNYSREIPQEELIEGYVPGHPEVFEEIESILRGKGNKSNIYQEPKKKYAPLPKLIESQTEPYDDQVELDVIFTSHYPEIINLFSVTLNNHFEKYLTNLSKNAQNYKEFLTIAKKESEKIVEVGSLAPGTEFIFVSKYPRENNEQVYTVKRRVNGKKGKKRSKLILCTSGYCFKPTQLVLVTK